MKTFRKSLLGFNKKDVVDYIDGLVKEKDGVIAERARQIETLKAELEEFSGVKGELEQAAGQNDMLKSGMDELLLAKARTERDLAKAESERAALESRAAELEKALSESAAALERASEEAEKAHGELNELLAESVEENRSLKKHNLRLLEANGRLEEALEEAKKAVPKTAIKTVPRPEYRRSQETGDSAVLGVFKARLFEISKDLEVLAQAIIAAESGVSARTEYHDGYGASAEEDYPSADNASCRRMNMREILERIKIIGDKLR